MSPEFDFKEQSRNLIKRLGTNPSAPLNAGLALAAVEAALREAYDRGKLDAKAPAARTGQGGARASMERQGRDVFSSGRSVPTEAPFSFAHSGRAAAKPLTPAPVAPAPPRECAHEWEEVLVDGRDLGAKCLDCGIMQREVQDRCDHYFVQTGSGEVCVACRKSRRSPR